MQTFRRTPIATALLLMASHSSVLAQAVADASAPTTLETVEVTGKLDRDHVRTDTTTIGKLATPLRDVPQSITVINRAMLNAQGTTSLSDALRNVPGITIGAAEGGQIGNNINLRGFTARTDIFIDGVRDRGQYYRDTFFIDTVEVLKGPSSMLFGRGSTGGVINQVSKQPTLASGSEASVTVGTHDQYRATLDTNQPMSDTSAFHLAVMGQNVQTTRDVMTNEDYGIAPSVRFGIGTPTTVTVSGLFQHNHDMADYGISSLDGKPAPVDYDNFYGLTDDRLLQDASVVGVRVEHRFSDRLTLRNQTQYDRTAIDSRETNSARVGTFVPAPGGGGAFTILPTSTTGYYTSLPLQSLSVLLQSKDRAIVDDSLFNQTDLIAEFDTGFVKHTLLTGFEVGRDTYQNQAITRVDPAITGPAATTGLAVLSLEHPAYHPSSSRTVSSNGNLVTSNANTVAAYVNDTAEVTPEIKLVGGLRFDRYRAVLNNTITSATVPSEVGQNVTKTSVRAGAIWQPAKEQSYYVSYGTSFNPSLETLAVTAGQQALAPEKNKSIEAGAKYDLFDEKLVDHRRRLPHRQGERPHAGVHRRVPARRQHRRQGRRTRHRRPAVAALAGLRRLHLPRRADRAGVGVRRHARQGAGQHAEALRDALDDLQHRIALRGRYGPQPPRQAVCEQHRRRRGRRLHPLGRHDRLAPADLRCPAEPAEHRRQGLHRRVDPVRRRALGAGYRSHRAADADDALLGSRAAHARHRDHSPCAPRRVIR